jgi:Nuclease-related domain
MPSDAALMSMLGPMLEIAPRVLLVMACGLLALAAVRISAPAIRQGCAGVFLAGRALGIVGVCGARIGFASLAFYGSPPMLQGVPDPISGLEIWRFLRAYEAAIALAVGSGFLIALWLRRGREVCTTKALSREARWRRIGAVGEARVAAELKRIGLPALHNVVLCGAGWSVELDHVVRVASGIVVLETKTFGGTIEGQLDSPVWTQRTVGGVELGGLANPVLQNQAHVWALEGFLGDLRVPICGYVVSAGRARFAPKIADAVVSVRDLRWVLSISFADPSPRVLDAAWRRLEREAAKSPGRRATHEAYARRRRDAFRARRRA